uniref:C2H2-type domain-containing protein n=1 Tax=Anguilla anguilla TaxID=7936 RepID=A0A0E9X7T3_ANGAN
MILMFLFMMIVLKTVTCSTYLIMYCYRCCIQLVTMHSALTLHQEKMNPSVARVPPEISSLWGVFSSHLGIFLGFRPGFCPVLFPL